MDYKKGNDYLITFNKMNNIAGFNALPVETQYILISKTISNLNNHLEKDIIFNQIKIESIKTEMLFYNNSLKSPHLYNVLSAFKDVSLEIQHLSKSFDNIINLLVKIKRNKVKSIKIGCSLYDLESKELAKKQFQNSNNITYSTFDSSIHLIPDDFFAKCKFVKRILIPSSITEIKKVHLVTVMTYVKFYLSIHHLYLKLVTYVSTILKSSKFLFHHQL